MPRIIYGGAPYDARPGDAVLETLWRNGVPVASACLAGTCQSCLLRATSGTLSPEAQRGLTPTQIKQGYFLACSMVPQGDLVIEPQAQRR